MIPYGRQDVNQDDIDSVVDVLKSDFLTQGPQVPLFEKAVTLYCGALHGVAVNSATSALHIACLSLGLGKDDILWTSPNTYVASANCALYCGAQVDFVDIDNRTYCMSVDALKIKLEKAEIDGSLPKVVIPVHFAGQPCDMPAIHKLSQHYGFKIIEDASHAIGATHNKIKIGACTHSDITVFSFHPVKIITTGEGGMAVTNNEELANRMRVFCSHGVTNNKAFMQSRPLNEIWNYQQIELGYNYRMTDIQAALGLSQISRLDEYIVRRHEIANRYDTELECLPVKIPWQESKTYSSYHLYPILIDERKSTKSQLELYDALRENGIMVNLHYIPVYRQVYYESLGFKKGYCPNAENYFKHTISIPIFPSMDHESQSKVINAISNELS